MHRTLNYLSDLKFKLQSQTKEAEDCKQSSKQLEELVHRLESRKEELKFENMQQDEEIQRLRGQLEGAINKSYLIKTICIVSLGLSALKGLSVLTIKKFNNL